jgi:glyoxylase-like metal-dependent hydrolase (beta-lactamase superfamily II)
VRARGRAGTPLPQCSEADAMPFLTEPEPPRGQAIEALPGISRIVAANPGVMTYHGTNTWLIDGPDGVTVLDPGPDDAGHVADILRAAGGPIGLILLSHTHRDHVGAVPALKAATDAPVAAFRHSADPGFTPDLPLDDGDTVAGMVAIHTPGHAADHLSFARRDGILFSADHVMSWSSSVVSPPGGDMGAYFASLRRLLARDDRLYLPGHGPPLPDPRGLVAEMLAHRTAREEAIAGALGAEPVATHELVDALYSQVHPTLRRAAERNVIAHLLKLEGEGRARRAGERWVA